MKNISTSMQKIDHFEKITGKAKYVCDYPTTDMLHGRILRSSIAYGVVNSVTLPELPDGYFYVDKNDVPAVNVVHIVQDDTPVFTHHVKYIGDPIGMIVGSDELVLNELFHEIKVEYKEQTPIFDARHSGVVFFDYNINKGDTDAAFSGADHIFEGDYETGLQEHMYLETNAMIAEYKDGKMYVHGSMQCPYYLHGAVAHATGLAPENVIIRQDVTGGGFGGKEDYPSVLACQVAVAAYKAKGKKVRVVFSREEDVIATSKRHPSFCTYKVALKDGKIIGMISDVLLDAGAYTTMSMVVLQRSFIAAAGVYDIPNLQIHGHARQTNTVPNGAFRGFGGPQTFFAIEMMMTHISRELGIDSADFKMKHFAKQGDLTSTCGKYHFPVPLPDMTKDILAQSDYHKKKEAYKNQKGRYRKGIGFSAVFHGVGFTGNGERDKIKAVVSLRKNTDDTVEILTSSAEMGQGVNTTFTKIVAAALEIPPERVIINLPDTSRVPDSGPTVASRSIMIVGELIRRAAERLKSLWKDGEEQIITEHYEHPDFMIPFDSENYKGDAYPTYSWAVTAVEVEIDTLTGYIAIPGVWASFDVGTLIDENIVIGQMEGGIVQSLGYGMMEKCAIRNGHISNKKLCDYIIPTALDFPNIKVSFFVDKYIKGPFGAKGAGELPHVGGAPAVLDAIQNALDTMLNKVPFMPEDIMEVLSC
ncbi:MAG: xanthine dehydrogenase family protein molybdopterin-binding subunit [Oscillospiraceae bacterium]|nr:xanthine dehydrogenase family protein molybdopterin-binding subunit [Oscillospiraceae bacterium]